MPRFDPFRPPASRNRRGIGPRRAGATGSRSRLRPRRGLSRTPTLLLCLLLAACRPDGPAEGSPAGPESPSTASATLAWDPPTTDADGEPLTDLAGYRLYFGRRGPLVKGESEFVQVGLVTEHTLEGLEPGTNFFAVSAVDEDGNESELSNEVAARLEAR